MQKLYPPSLLRNLRTAISLAILATTIVGADAQRFVKTFNTPADLVASNPNDVHTNAFVASSGLVYSYSAGSAAATNAEVLKPNNFNGRWLQANGYTAVTNGLHLVLAPGAATMFSIQDWLAQVKNARSYGVTNDYSVDNSVFLQAWINAAQANGGTGEIPPGKYKYGTSLVITNAVHLRGIGAVEKWGQGVTNRPVTLYYTGSGNAIEVRPNGTYLESVKIENIHLDGGLASGSANGLVFDLTGADKVISNSDFRDLTVTDFPQRQIYTIPGTASSLWNFYFDRLHVNNRNRLSATNLVEFPTGPAYAELYFNDCHFIPASENTVTTNVRTMWGLKVANGTTVINGGTLNVVGPGASGAFLSGSGSICGVHAEGISESYTNTLTSIGIRVTGASWFISPISTATLATGIQIGDPDNPSGLAASVTIAGTAYGANVRDVHIVAGGSRARTVILSTGNSGGQPFVLQDDRASIDGVREVTQMNLGYLSLPPGSAANAAIRFFSSASVGIAGDESTSDIIFTRAGEKARISSDGVHTTGLVVTNSMNVATNTLAVDESSRRVGIGTNAPTQTLEIMGTEGTAIGSLLFSKHGSRGRLNILSYAQDNVAFSLDSYFNGTWLSSSSNLNVLMNKDSLAMNFAVSSGVTNGGAITWTNALRILANGSTEIPKRLLIPYATASRIAVIGADGGLTNGTLSEANIQPLDPELTALANQAGTGIYVITGPGTGVTRALIGNTEIVFSNGDGVAGNPTATIGADIARDAEMAALYTPLTRTITAGSGLTGGGNLSADRTIAVDWTIGTNSVTVACSDMTTALAAGANKAYWRAPFAMTVKKVKASVFTASSSGLVTVDINDSGTTILSTKLTIDATEKTSETAAVAAVISDTSIANDAEITFDIDAAGTSAAGLLVQIYYTIQ